MSTQPSDNCYGNAQLPKSREGLAARLRHLREDRDNRAAKQRLEPRQRGPKTSREKVLEKTDGHCHICGGIIEEGSYWEVDHLSPSSSGGPNTIGNYLPAHGLCNSAKLDQQGEDLQWTLKIGVWAKKQIEDETELGRKLLDRFWARERQRLSRQKLNSKLTDDTVI